MTAPTARISSKWLFLSRFVLELKIFFFYQTSSIFLFQPKGAWNAKVLLLNWFFIDYHRHYFGTPFSQKREEYAIIFLKLHHNSYLLLGNAPTLFNRKQMKGIKCQYCAAFHGSDCRRWAAHYLYHANTILLFPVHLHWQLVTTIHFKWVCRRHWLRRRILDLVLYWTPNGRKWKAV